MVKSLTRGIGLVDLIKLQIPEGSVTIRNDRGIDIVEDSHRSWVYYS